MADPCSFDERFCWLLRGRWFDSIGNTIVVSVHPGGEGLKAAMSPLVDHPSACHRVLTITKDRSGNSVRPSWRCGGARLELADEQQGRVVWVTEDGRRCVWSKVNSANGNVNANDVHVGGKHSSKIPKELTATSGAAADAPFAPWLRSENRFPNGDRPTPGSANSIRASAPLAPEKDADGRGRRRRDKESIEEEDAGTSDQLAFPWLQVPDGEVQTSSDVPDDILWDGSRVAALLDIRQMIGARNEPQERLTHILMDYDLTPGRDYLVPGENSDLWETLKVSEGVRRQIYDRIMRIPHEAMSHHVTWSGDSEVWVGHHKIDIRSRALDVQALKARWTGDATDPRKPVEMARLLALYSVLDNPLSLRRSGLHLGISPELRQMCDYELFASPLNAVVPNGRYASKWPHIEWRFGSMGKYPTVLSELQVGSVVCVNPPFTDAYLEHVMGRLAELKLRFRLRFAVPIQEASWRNKLIKAFPSAQLLHTYYDTSSDSTIELCHPTIFWEDPRCPQMQPNSGAQRFSAGDAYGKHDPPAIVASGAPNGTQNGVQQNGHDNAWRPTVWA